MSTRCFPAEPRAPQADRRTLEGWLALLCIQMALALCHHHPHPDIHPPPPAGRRCCTCRRRGRRALWRHGTPLWGACGPPVRWVGGVGWVGAAIVVGVYERWRCSRVSLHVAVGQVKGPGLENGTRSDKDKSRHCRGGAASCAAVCMAPHCDSVCLTPLLHYNCRPGDRRHGSHCCRQGRAYLQAGKQGSCGCD